MQWSRATQTLERALALAQQAAALDDALPMAHMALGWAYTWGKQPEQALAALERAIALDPETRRCEEAIAAFQSLLTRNPDDLLAHIFLAALYSGAGWEERARAEAAEVLRLNPQFSVDVWRQTLPLKDQAELKDFLDHLRKAGLT